MYCPIFGMNPNNSTIPFSECIKDACAWWIVSGTTGTCAICKMGEYAASH
ncbi:Hypothetical protein LUCI_4961 [Lucifera butyrica]|uniref:Uncharacterized protein n=1 Tax=Lucifera butyrica TaxID=1351585 RepID=A0A498RHS8_9FIRM|nr:hypothetical protein [Lucifera butyrica]VBB09663.1 Hypothetical protein LUCI_4961 [Lucifera butyrica]